MTVYYKIVKRLAAGTVPCRKSFGYLQASAQEVYVKTYGDKLVELVAAIEKNNTRFCA